MENSFKEQTLVGSLPASRQSHEANLCSRVTETSATAASGTQLEEAWPNFLLEKLSSLENLMADSNADVLSWLDLLRRGGEYLASRESVLVALQTAFPGLSKRQQHSSSKASSRSSLLSSTTCQSPYSTRPSSTYSSFDATKDPVLPFAVEQYRHILSPTLAKPCDTPSSTAFQIIDVSSQSQTSRKRQKYFCKRAGCEKGFTVKQSYHRHVEEQHAPQQICRCSCGKEFKLLDRLASHLKAQSDNSHFEVGRQDLSQKRIASCGFCSKIFHSLAEYLEDQDAHWEATSTVAAYDHSLMIRNLISQTHVSAAWTKIMNEKHGDMWPDLVWRTENTTALQHNLEWLNSSPNAWILATEAWHCAYKPCGLRNDPLEKLPQVSQGLEEANIDQILERFPKVPRNVMQDTWPELQANNLNGYSEVGGQIPPSAESSFMDLDFFDSFSSEANQVQTPLAIESPSSNDTSYYYAALNQLLGEGK